MGQLFYSVACHGHTTSTHGSYMQKDNIIGALVRPQIEVSDYRFRRIRRLSHSTVVSQLAMFVTLPMVFENMAFGTLIGVVFLFWYCSPLMETIVSGGHRQGASSARRTLWLLFFRRSVSPSATSVGSMLEPHAVPGLLRLNSALMPMLVFAFTRTLVGHDLGANDMTDQNTGEERNNRHEDRVRDEIEEVQELHANDCDACPRTVAEARRNAEKQDNCGDQQGCRRALGYAPCR